MEFDVIDRICFKSIIKTKGPGVHSFMHNEQLYWLKISGENKRNLASILSHILSKKNMFFSNKSFLKPEVRFIKEKQMLTYLNYIKFNVPEIIDEGDNYFVTKDCGLNLKSISHDKISDELIYSVFDVFISLHNENIIHGRPALRDILYNRGKIILIDFEESLFNNNPKLKARDILLLLIDLERLPFISDQIKIENILKWKNEVGTESWHELISIMKIIHRYSIFLRLNLKIKPNNRFSLHLTLVIDLFKKLKVI